MQFFCLIGGDDFVEGPLEKEHGTVELIGMIDGGAFFVEGFFGWVGADEAV